jgi:replicative DNA helicase
MDSAVISNVQNEIMIVGCFFKDPNLYVEYNKFIKSKYDFSDEACKFFYENGEIIFKKRTQTFNQNTVNIFMTEDEERLTKYKKYGGWKIIEHWMSLALLDDFKSYFEVLKKYSLLREYSRNGFNVQKIIDHPKFNLFGALDVYRLVRSKADKISTVILANNEPKVLNEGMSDVIFSCLESPDMGVPTCFPVLNDLIRGLRRGTMMAVCMLSNAGKSRFMIKMIAHLALVKKEKVLVMLNEMSISDMKLALLTTCVNNPEFQELHGVILNKKEKEIALGLFRQHDTQEFIYREKDENGDFVESLDEFVLRLSESSTEYDKVLKIAKWIEKQTEGLIYTVDLSTSYTDEDLEHNIRKMHLVHNVNYFFYDTLKNGISNIGDWASFKLTTTKLSELCTELNIYGYGSIQMSDDAQNVQPMELNSLQIASSKHIKHVLTTLCMFKEIDKEDYHKYYYEEYNEGWGTPAEKNLNLDKRYYICVLDKNRAGSKKRLLFEVQLDYNLWIECGEVFRK